MTFLLVLSSPIRHSFHRHHPSSASNISSTHQGRGALGVVGVPPRPLQHGHDLVSGEVAGVQVGADDGAGHPRLVLELSQHGALLKGEEGARVSVGAWQVGRLVLQSQI